MFCSLTCRVLIVEYQHVSSRFNVKNIFYVVSVWKAGRNKRQNRRQLEKCNKFLHVGHNY